jgi:cytochrome c oxidase subunit 3
MARRRTSHQKKHQGEHHRAHRKGSYYIPAPSYWPIIGSIGLFCMLFGAANWLHGKAFAPYLTILGALVLIFMIYGWLSTVIRENQAGVYTTAQNDRSFRWGMAWFIFTEVCFFGAFFAALFYARLVSVPTLGGEGSRIMTHLLLWPSFQATWPVYHNPNPTSFVGPKSSMEAWGIPALNTLILLSSGVTITIAHWGLVRRDRLQLIIFQILTIVLGIAFLAMQIHEYGTAYTTKGLRLNSGIYGTTFFMLTGFHGLHVTLGTIMLCVILLRIIKRHFTPKNQFGFEAVSWYWHFVDVVWLGLFIFVYWW